MRLAVPKERRAQELRVAATPETVRKLIALGASVCVESGAGGGAFIADEAFAAAGATIAANAAEAVSGADIVLKVQRPLRGGNEQPDELGLFRAGQVLIGMLDPLFHRDDVAAYGRLGLTVFAMEMVPRISRAQAMDVLSSQANLAGYKAVLDACEHYCRALPMMMTAAGTVAPARVFVMGVGVAGLQAIATARRLGAIVSATDVRLAVKEQVQSLGASFVMVEDEETKSAETAGGYAKEMSEAYQIKQAELVAETVKKQDIVICTALIPGRRAPLLLSETMVRSMKPGSVVVDLAIETGGNCAFSKANEVVRVDGVKIVAYRNVASRLAADASALYARNLLAFLSLLIDKTSKQIKIDWTDEIVAASCLAREGTVVHPEFNARVA